MNSVASELSESQLAELRSSSLFNEDLAPVPSSGRRWRAGSFAALWISMSACIPTYMLASSLVDKSCGMNWWQAILTIFLGNLIVLVPMILNADAGTRYGIPFPVYCRASFGTIGANIPALLRALVACGWFGIQTWIGGSAIYKILGVFFPVNHHRADSRFSPDQRHATALFLAFSGASTCWSFTKASTASAGSEHQSAAVNCARAAAAILGLPKGRRLRTDIVAAIRVCSRPTKEGQFWKVFFPVAHRHGWLLGDALVEHSGFLALRSKPARPGHRSNAWSASHDGALFFHRRGGNLRHDHHFGQTIWDPVDVLTRFTNPVLLVIAMLALCIATLATNIAANVVSPANDFAHLAPRFISFRLGGLITGVIGILMMPWKLVARLSGYIFNWLIGYGALLGPIGGILIADYYVWRRRELNLQRFIPVRRRIPVHQRFQHRRHHCIGSRRSSQPARFSGAGAPLERRQSCAIPCWALYNYAWFVGFSIAFARLSRWPKLTAGARPAPVSVPEPEAATK